jgi:hypothetical protein
VKIGRNEKCPCGSGKKYKYCCYSKDSNKKETPEIDETEPTAAAEEETADTKQKKKTASYQRTKFHGDKSSLRPTFQSRIHRGSQRGK